MNKNASERTSVTSESGEHEFMSVQSQGQLFEED